MKTHNNCAPARNHCGSDDDGNVIKVGDKTYDLSTKAGKAAFEKDVEDRKLDGKAGGALGGCADGVVFDRKTNEVTVGSTTYDLDKKSEREAFKRDAADGFIDGKTAGSNNKQVKVGDKTYDVSTEKGKKQLEQDVEAGNITGVDIGGCGQVSYDRKTNTLRAGDKEYDLDNPKEVKSFHLDSNDGALDGRDSRHLRTVKLGGKEYDLTTEYGQEEFKNDCNDGTVDVQTLGCGGLEYDPATNSVRAGEKTYKLDDPKQVKALQADAADGLLDGVDSKHLKKLDVDGTRYDLTTDEGRTKLATAFEEGDFDFAFDDATYDPASNTVTVGDKTYDLKDPKQAKAFRSDAADGMLDGEISRQSLRC